jgi:cell division protein FtsL
VGSVVFFLALLGAVGVQGERIRTQEAADALRRALTEAEDHRRELQVAVAGAESPRRVLDVARDAGMVEPGPVVALPAGPTDRSLPLAPPAERDR